MPDRMKAWEERTIYLSGLHTYATNAVSMFGKKMPSTTAVKTLNEIADMDDAIFESTETRDKTDVMEELAQKVDGVVFDTRAKRIVGMNGLDVSSIGQINFLCTEEGLQNMEQVVGDLVDALREKAKQTEDPAMKRYYSGFADIGDPTKGNYTQALLTSPYLAHFVPTIGSGPSVSDFTPEDLKEGLGEDLYQALFRSYDSYTNEFRVEYHRQALEKNWSKEAEQQYLKELYAAHEECLRSFDNLG